MSAACLFAAFIWLSLHSQSVHAQESSDELTWEELKTLAEDLKIEGISSDFDSGHPEALQGECFNQLLHLCLSDRGVYALYRFDQNKLAKIRDAHGNSLLHLVVKDGGEEEVVKYLVSAERTAGVRSVNLAKETPLHFAARAGRVVLIEPLKGYQFYKNSAGETPFHVAIRHDRGHFVARLKGECLEPCTVDGLELSPVALAAKSNAKRSFRALAPTFKELTQSISGVGNLLHLLVRFGQVDMVEWLFRDKVYLLAMETLLLKEDESYHRIPFASACATGDLEMAELLHEKGKALVGGAHLNYSDSYSGWSPAHWAASQSHFPIVYALAEWGAKLDSRDNKRCRPEDVAKKIKGYDAQDTVTALQSALNVDSKVKHQLPHNLVIRGGGPRGAAYVGVIRALKEKGIDDRVYRTAGTSAGAITVILYALAYTADEMEEELKKKNLLALLDPKDATCDAVLHAVLSGKNKRSYTEAIKALLSKGAGHIIASPDQVYRELTSFDGLCKGEDARKWVEELIRKQVRKIAGEDIPHLTFGELRRLIGHGKPFKHIRLFATRITGDQKLVCLSSEGEGEDSAFDHVIISDAVLASMSIPGVFEPHALHIKDPKTNQRKEDPSGDRYVDGGLIRNRPVETFDDPSGLRNRRTLCLSLRDVPVDGDVQKQAAAPSGPLELVRAVASIYMEAESLLQDMSGRSVVEVPIRGVGLLDFDMSEGQIDQLIQAGYETVMTSPLFSLGSDEIKKEFRHRDILAPLTNFTGRAVERKQLVSDLRDRTLPFHKGSIVHLISGPRGIGKTELARKALDEALDPQDRSAYAFELDYRDLNRSYRRIANQLKIDLPGQSDPLSLRRNVISFLEELSDPWYLIVNNVEKDQRVDQSLLPRRGGHIIVTAHHSGAWSKPKNSIPLKPLSPREGAELISKITGEPISGDLCDLAERLGGYPLAIDQAARYICGYHAADELNDLTVKEYLNSLYRKTVFKAGLEPDAQRYAETLGEVWDTTFQHLKEKHPLVWEWLCFSSWLDSEEISREWLEHWLQHREGGNGKPPEKEVVDRIVKVLRSYGIVRELSRNESGEYRSRHALLQEALREPPKSSKLKPLGKSDFLRTAKFVLDHSHVCGNTTDQYREATSWLSHLRTLTDHATALQLGKSREIRKMIKRQGEIYYHIFGDYQSALEFYQRVLRMEKEHSVDLSDIAKTNLAVGNCYVELFDPTNALPYIKACVEGTEKRYGADSAKLYTPLTRLFFVHYRNKEYSEALATLKRLDTLVDQSHDVSDHDRAALVHNYGVYYYGTNDFPSAIKKFKAAKAEFTRHIQSGDISEDNPDFIQTNCSLGCSYYGNKDYELARPLHKWVLGKRRDLFHSDHPLVAEALMFYGQDLSKLGERGEAMIYLREGFEIAVRIYSSSNPDFGRVLDAIGECVEGMSYAERKPLLDEILPTCLAVCDPKNEKVVRLVKAAEKPWWPWS